MKKNTIIAIIGRPNVGKSTLFNRLIGRQSAITSPVAHTTRDRHFGIAKWHGKSWTVVDTAGIIGDDSLEDESMQALMDEQITIAIEEADFVIHVINVQEQIHSQDRLIVQRLNREKKPFIVAANKADNTTIRHEAEHFQRLGIATLIPISSMHGTGIGDIFDFLSEHVQANQSDDSKYPRVAIVGRPNVGKSHLINQIVGQKRTIVSPIPGTTRDSIITQVTLPNNNTIELIDTAGIKRRGRTLPGIDKYALFRTIQAINLSDVVILVLTIEESPTRGDAHIADYALESGKSLVLALNKIDLATEDIHKLSEAKKKNLAQRFLYRFPFLSQLPAYFISAETGTGISEMLHALSERFKATPIPEP